MIVGIKKVNSCDPSVPSHDRAIKVFFYRIALSTVGGSNFLIFSQGTVSFLQFLHLLAMLVAPWGIITAPVFNTEDHHMDRKINYLFTEEKH